MRYRGQGFEIAVELDEDLASIGPERLRERFETNYEALYGRVIPGLDVEILSWTLNLSETKPERESETDAANPQRHLKADAQREMFDVISGSTVSADCLNRETLSPGDYVEGPALISEPQTTVVVGSGYTACVTDNGDLMMWET